MPVSNTHKQTHTDTDTYPHTNAHTYMRIRFFSQVQRRKANGPSYIYWDTGTLRSYTQTHTYTHIYHTQTVSYTKRKKNN